MKQMGNQMGNPANANCGCQRAYTPPMGQRNARPPYQAMDRACPVQNERRESREMSPCKNPVSREMKNPNPVRRDMGCGADRRKAMTSVYEWGFVLVETALFLDTHPDDGAALEYYAQAKEKYKAAVAFFSEKFGPLNLTSVQNENYWTWAATPLPWEMEG